MGYEYTDIDYWEIIFDGEPYRALNHSYYDGPLDFYIKELDVYMRSHNYKRTHWTAYKGYGEDIHKLNWDDLHDGSREYIAYTHPKITIGDKEQLDFEEFIPMDINELDWSET